MDLEETERNGDQTKHRCTVMQAVRALARRVTMKRVVGTVAGCGGLVAAQAVYYQASYVPMRGPADGGTCGIEHWEDHEDDEGAQRRDGGGAPGWSLRDPRRWRNVLIVGDSLVVGIGCKERSVLPQVISRSLANALKVDVSWRTIGVDGGDMKTIHANVLETVKRFQDEQTARIKAADEEQSELALSQHSALPSCDKAPGGARADHSEEVGTSIVRNVSGGLPVVKMKIMEHLQHKPPQVKLAGEALFDFVSTSMRRRVQGAGGEPAPRAGVDAVVVMVGLNDFKKILRGSTSPGLFRSDIESFMRDLREQVGPDCIVVFPVSPPPSFPVLTGQVSSLPSY